MDVLIECTSGRSTKTIKLRSLTEDAKFGIAPNGIPCFKESDWRIENGAHNRASMYIENNETWITPLMPLHCSYTIRQDDSPADVNTIRYTNTNACVNITFENAFPAASFILALLIVTAKGLAYKGITLIDPGLDYGPRQRPCLNITM